MRHKGFAVLAAVTVAVAAGAMLTLDRGTGTVPQAGAPLFPGLLARVNDVTAIDVRAGSGPFRLARKDGKWVAPGKDDHPLAADKVHALVVGAAGLERVEPKTGDAKRFAELGLRDPGEEGSRAVEFVLRDAADAPVASLIAGEHRPARGDPTRNEYFVRVPGEERSWLVRGNLPQDVDDAVAWLDRRIATIDAARIARVRVTHADGTVVTATRDAPGRGDFRYAEMPAGAELTGAWVINDIGRVLADLSLEDVARAPDTLEAPGALEAVVETFDGLRVTLRAWLDGELTRATLRAAFDEALAAPATDGKPAQGLLGADEVRAQADSLDARWRPWVYVLPDYKGDYLRRREKDLVKAPAAPQATPESGPAAPASTN